MTDAEKFILFRREVQSIMAEKIKYYVQKYRDVITYLFFGVLTTLVNYIVYLPCHYTLGLSATLSNILAWVVAVAFAYLTNKPFVFGSHDWSFKTVGPELAKFLSCRIGSGVLETLILMVTVDILGWNGAVWKLVTQVLVVILNYVGSKLLVFRKKK